MTDSQYWFRKGVEALAAELDLVPDDANVEAVLKGVSLIGAEKDVATGQEGQAGRCQETESGGVQCELVIGHKSYHWINMHNQSRAFFPEPQKHPEAYFKEYRA